MIVYGWKMKNELTGFERQNEILNVIKREKSVSVNELSERFQVTKATIRTDLTRLEQSGEIKRTHGGAVLNVREELEPRLLDRMNQEEKMRIAAQAIDYVNDHEVILIDTGTTAFAFAQALVKSDKKDLMIYSNDMSVLLLLESRKDFSLNILGGKIRSGFHYAYGENLIDELKLYHFDKLFLTASAMDVKSGLTTVHPDLARLKQAMIKASREVIVLTDSTKYGKTHFQRYASLSDIDVLITDSGISEEGAAQLNNYIDTVIVC